MTAQTVSCPIPDDDGDGDGEVARARVVANHAGGTLSLWLDPGLPTDAVVAFYRIYEQSESPEESWGNFQEGDAAPPRGEDDTEPLGAVEMLPGGHYRMDMKLFTGFDTVTLPQVSVEMQADPVDPATAAGDARFRDRFDALLRRFLEQSQREEELLAYVEAFDASDFGRFYHAVVAAGGPQDYCDDYEDIRGFFEFIDFAAALTIHFGEAATSQLKKFPDSPTNTHYIHYIRQYASDQRFVQQILEKYPACKPR